MKVVIQTGRSHAGIFLQRVVLPEPVENGRHARVAALEVGIDVTEHARVADAAIGAQRDPARRGVGFTARHAIAGIVHKAAFVFRIFRRPRLAVIGGQVLAVLKEMDRRFPIQVAGLGVILVLREVPAVVERLERLQSVPHVRVLVMAAVTDAAIKRIVGFALFIEVVLQADQEAPRPAKHRVVFRLVRREQRHHAERSIVGGQIGPADAAVGVRAAQDEGVSPL